MDWRSNDRLGRRRSVSRIWKQGRQILRSIRPYAYANSHGHTYNYSHSYSYSHTYSYSHSYSHTDPLHREMCTHPQATSYSRTTALVYGIAVFSSSDRCRSIS